jgi:membrane protein DedA with SNARE-associated domain
MTEALPWPVQDIAEWMPLWKASGFFLATFVLEDAAAIGAGLLLAAGAISWPAAFVSCFLGIWMGDAGLYSLARFGGRQWFEKSSLRRFAGKVEQSEQWFAKRGTLILIFSRMIPGARLPTYLAAGFLRLPLPRFLSITGIASFAWTLIVLWLTQLLGVQVIHLLSAYKHGGFVVAGIGVALFVLVQLSRRRLAGFNLRHFVTRLERWRHWEFWPAWLFYPPVAFYCLWLAVKYRGLALPTIANPGIPSGGLVGESKIATLNELFASNPEFTAEAAMIDVAEIESRVRSVDQISERFGFPFIIKPDVGQRGAGIRLIRRREQALEYLRQTPAPLVAQRYAPGPLEAGIFYYRFPHESRGHIFAITEKIFPYVTGDGRSTIGDLIHNDPRARFMAGKYLKRFDARQDYVLPVGETLKLVESGNHAQGCIFRDGMRLYTSALLERIDAISQNLPGFYIGRYDVRYSCDNDLRTGKNFQIIELNGAASEATSIYDARNSLVAAYRTLFNQWNLVFAIGAANRGRGWVVIAPSAIFSKWREYLKLAATYPGAD